MRLHLETTSEELREKAPELLRQLAGALEGETPDLAKALEQVADDAQQAAQTGGRPGERVLDQLLEQAHQVYARRMQQMLEAISLVVARDHLLAVQKADPWVEVGEQVGARLWLALGLPEGEDDQLEKAAGGLEGSPKAGHKYLRRVPYTGKDGKRHYRYFYHEAALGRQAQAGETVRLGAGRALQVVEVDREGRVSFEEEAQAGEEAPEGAPQGGQDKPGGATQGGEDAPEGAVQGGQGKRKRTVSADEWATVLGEHYGQEVVDRAIERRAMQAVRAVTRHVPADLLADLEGETDDQRMADLQRRVPDVYDRLQKAFKRAGIDPARARQVVARSLARRGWEGEARAAAIGSVLTPEGAQLARRHVQLLDAAEGLAGGRRVRARHVQAAADLLQASSEKFVAEVEDVAARAEGELARLHQLLEAARQAPPGEPGEPVGRLLQAAMQSPAVRELLKLAQAFPGLQDRAIPVAQQIVPQVVAEAPRAKPTTEGGPTQVFVAGEGGRPRALRARYKLVEAHDLQASHKPGEGFKTNEAYPQDVQERAYHRDKQEQMKVLRNAQQLNPAFVANTNPDAVNGPPLVTAGGVVLGGNSRTMSMQRVYAEHPEKAKELQQFLAEHAHEFGFKPEDVHALRNPVLVRVVDVPDERPETLRLLVRQFNESFTQGMDPRTMQVAMGRKLDDRALQDLAGSMQADESLGDFLGSSRAESFVQALYRAGVIDDRNSNQFVRKGTRQLNEDGKQLVGRILVGRMVGDADLLSETRAKALESISNSVPAMVLAQQAGPGFNLAQPLKTAMSALNVLQAKVDAGLMKPLDARVSGEQLGHLVRNFLQDMFGEQHPVLKDDRAMAMLEVFVRRPGPVQMARVFREYARLAQQNPEGQAGLFGAAKTPAEVFRLAIEQATKGEAKETAQAKAEREAPKVKVVKRKLKPGEQEAQPAAEPAEDTGSSVPAAGVPEEQAAMFSLEQGEQGEDLLEKAAKASAGGPYIGPRGGKWADPDHTIPWDPTQHKQTSIFDFQPPPGMVSRADRAGRERPPLERALAMVEEKIRNLPEEQVHMLDERGGVFHPPLQGGKHSCKILPEILQKVKDSGSVTMTHNHPSGGCFSIEDLFLAGQWNMQELRATTPDGVFVLPRPAGGWFPEGKKWTDVYAVAWDARQLGIKRASKLMDKRLKTAGGPPPGEDHPAFREEVWHAICGEEVLKAYRERLGKAFGWEPRFEPRSGGATQPGGGGAGGSNAGRGRATPVQAWEGEQRGLLKGGPYVGPRGGLWANPQHTEHWDPKVHGQQQAGPAGGQLGLFAHQPAALSSPPPPAPPTPTATEVEVEGQVPAVLRPQVEALPGGGSPVQAAAQPHPAGGRQGADQGAKEKKGSARDRKLRSNLEIDGYARAGTSAAFDFIGPHEKAFCVRCGAQIGHVFFTNKGPLGGDCLATLTGDDSTRRLTRKVREAVQKAIENIKFYKKGKVRKLTLGFGFGRDANTVVLTAHYAGERTPFNEATGQYRYDTQFVTSVPAKQGPMLMALAASLADDNDLEFQDERPGAEATLPVGPEQKKVPQLAEPVPPMLSAPAAEGGQEEFPKDVQPAEAAEAPEVGG